MPKIRSRKKLDIFAGCSGLGLILALLLGPAVAPAQMTVTYKRSSAPLVKKQTAQAPIKITLINTKKKANKRYSRKVIAQNQAVAPEIVSITATDTQTSTLGHAPVVKKEEKKWGVSSSFAYYQSMMNQADGSASSYGELTLGGSYTFDSFNTSATLYASRDMKNEISTLDDLLLGVSLKPIDTFNKSLKLTLGSKLGPAVSKDDQFASLIIKSRIFLKMDLDSKKLKMGGFSVGGYVDIRKNFHEYTQAQNGKVNSEWASLQTLSGGFNFTDKLSTGVTLVHYNSWSYTGYPAEYFSHVEEISYQATKAVAISGGHQMGYPFVGAWKANGSERNFDLTNDNNSMLFATVSVSY